mmetsp:Transcript_23241/g.22394  ORF Transcript_23241/g.22394 Transcript_23241/m.22394 type:complete len:311 (+) Transcript_23241:93-1025(+)
MTKTVSIWRMVFGILFITWTTEASYPAQIVPTNLHNLGIKLFKSEMRFNEVISNMSQPVTFNVTGIPIILVENKNDMSLHKLKYEVFGPAFNSDGYGFSRIGASNYGTMIDIGANIGSISIFLAKKYPNWRIISFEPAPVTYFYFRYNMFLNNITEISGFQKRNESGGIRAINSAVGSQKGNMEFTYSNYNSQLATFSDISTGLNGWHKVIISVVSVSNIINRFGLDVIDFLKMDCEGCEIEVIPSIKTQFIDKKKIRYVGAEIHQTLLSPTKKGDDEPMARRRNATAIRNLIQTLELRGYPTKEWSIVC